MLDMATPASSWWTSIATSVSWIRSEIVLAALVWLEIAFLSFSCCFSGSDFVTSTFWPLIFDLGSPGNGSASYAGLSPGNGSASDAGLGSDPITGSI